MADTHIPPEDLLRYIEEQVTEDERETMDAHVDVCDECAFAIITYRELTDLNTLDPPRTEKETKSSRDTLKDVVKGAAGIVGGLVAGLQLRPHSHAFRPSFASGDHQEHHDENNSHEAVRNADHGDSSPTVGHHEEHETMGAAAQGWIGYVEADKQFGHAPNDHRSHAVQQTHDDTCAIQCQRLILNNFGIDITEESLIHEAAQKGIYAPGEGTHPEDLGKLLEAHQIHVHRELHANVFNLTNELAQGHQVMVGLDADDLWQKNTFVDKMRNDLGLGHANHAVIVSGIDTSDPQHLKVNITDPGSGHIAKQYPMEEFLRAWHTSNFCMVSTVEPLPPWHKEMVNFDYSHGHVDEVGGAPFAFVSEMSQATTHEKNHGTMSHLHDLFSSVVDHTLSMNDLVHHAGHMGVAGHVESMHSFVEGLKELARGKGFEAAFAHMNLHQPEGHTFVNLLHQHVGDGLHHGQDLQDDHRGLLDHSPDSHQLGSHHVDTHHADTHHVDTHHVDTHHLHDTPDGHHDDDHGFHSDDD